MFKKQEYTFNTKKFTNQTWLVWSFTTLFFTIFSSIAIYCYTNSIVATIITTLSIVLFSIALYAFVMNRRQQTIITVQPKEDKIILSYYRKNDPENEVGSDIDVVEIKNYSSHKYEKNKLYIYGDITITSIKNGEPIKENMSRVGIYNYFNFNEEFFNALKISEKSFDQM